MILDDLIMTKNEKKKLLEELHNNGMYYTALESIKNETEKKQIKAFVDDVYINLVDSLTNILTPAQEIGSEDQTIVIPNE